MKKRFEIEWEKLQQYFNYAIRKGMILKPDICELCRRKFPLKQICGHHPEVLPKNIKLLTLQSKIF